MSFSVGHRLFQKEREKSDAHLKRLDSALSCIGVGMRTYRIIGPSDIADEILKSPGLKVISPATEVDKIELRALVPVQSHQLFHVLASFSSF